MASTFETHVPPSRPRPRPMPREPSRAAVEELGRALATRIRGEVRFTDGDRALWATDA